MKKILLFFLCFCFPMAVRAETNSSYLKDFQVFNGTMSIPFQAQNNVYTIYLNENAVNLEFSYLLEDETATVEVLNNEYVSGVTNEMTIKVKSKDQTSEQIYSFYLEKEEDVKASFATEEYAALNIPTQKKIPYLAPIIITSVLCIIALLFKFLIWNFWKKEK